jgi:hypothetical protein
VAEGICSIEDCDDPVFVQKWGWCVKHYSCWNRNGDPLKKRPRPRRPLEERFWEKVNKRGPVPQHRPELGPCWPWTGCLSPRGNGYGYIGDGNRSRRASQVSWELHFGPIPEGQQACHHCDNKPCVRPEHLFLGTWRQNMADMRSKERHARGEAMGAARLTAAQVLEIRAAVGPQSVLASRYGVSQATISDIKCRRTWKHL